MNTTTQDDCDSPDDVELTFGNEQVVIRKRYEIASILNDFLIAIWFLIGSIFFLYPDTTRLGTWLFIIGSTQFLARPVIRLARHIHVRRLPHGPGWDM